MENECKWYQNALMSELTEGMELTKQLNTHLINLSASSIHPQQFHLLQNILSSYQKALHILQPLQSSSSSSPNVTPTHDHHRHSASKKRKMSSNQVRIRSESGLECPSEDGYSWRKYGQKDILAAKYPRSYYRCTYRHVQGCRATKQVQRSDEDPSLFDITYKGKHTCNRHRSPTPQMQEINHHHMHQQQQEQEQQINNETLLNLRNNLRVEMQEINHHHHMQQQQQEQHINNETLLNLRNNLRVDTHNNEQSMMASHFPFPSTSFDPFSTLFVDDNLLGGLSSSGIKFLSPETDTSEYSNNYFPTNSCERNGFNDLSEIISANTSVSNSPVDIYDLDFSNEPAELGSFTFDDYNCNWN